ncbi:MAG: lysine--tRNA ligase [Chlamydiales bacterium]|nr:lysine--tRNA ligase [Chlamydiales bacterium]
MTEKPDYHQHEEYRNRLSKLSELRDLGIEPYPHKYEPTANPEELQTKYHEQPVGNSEEADAGTTDEASVAGRMILYRAMGKNAFATIQGGDGRIQIMFNRDNTKVAGYEGEAPAKIIEKKFDLGDIIGVKGHLFRTQKGELTIFAKEVTLLTKTLLPLPDKHAGLADKELRYRKRWLDLISNPEIRDTFKNRSLIQHWIRQYFNDLDFLEVETPVLQGIYGGAEARPFETRLNALDQHMFMRISLEPSLKKLVVGGMDRVFEMGKVFRNEGIDRSHNPEFTMLEAYAAYWDYNDMMQLVENLYEMLAMRLFNSTKVPVTIPGQEEPLYIDVKAPWKRISMKDSLKTYANIDVDALTDEQMRKHLLDSGKIDPAKVKGLTTGLLIGAMFEVEVEHHLIQPHHITDHPEETTPLCKVHRGEKERKEGLIERFESFILAGEICNAYSELNDPVKQRELLEFQNERRDSGDEEASPMDEEFLEAICQGMPPAGGVGIGIDRLIMLFTNSHSIRDVLYFPWMKDKAGKD